MRNWRPRETRKSVRISVRVRTDSGWIDATVRNVSNRGMMLHSLEPLRCNQFVEIERGRHRVVGRIVWSDATTSGLQARDCFDLEDLLTPRSASAVAKGERHGLSSQQLPPARVASLGERAEAARMRGRAYEFVFVAAAAASVATMATISVGEMLAEPLDTVERAIEHRGPAARSGPFGSSEQVPGAYA